MKASPGAYLQRHAQEHLVYSMMRLNGDVSALETSLAAVELHLGRHLDQIPDELPRLLRPQTQGTGAGMRRRGGAAAATRRSGAARATSEAIETSTLQRRQDSLVPQLSSIP